MDTYENDRQTTENQPDDGFYHGTGSNTTENLNFFNQGTEENRSRERPATQKPSGGIGKKAGIACAAVVTAFALVIAGCGLSAAAMNRYWKNQNNLMEQSFEQRMEVLRQELEKNQNSVGETVKPVTEGLLPSQIYDQNINAIVAVTCTTKTTQLGQTFESVSAGSGFVWTSDGYIITNHHVISGASTITVTFADGTEMSAKLIGSDATNDIALLKVEASDLQTVKIGSSSALKVGDQVVAIGNALGELSFSLTVGYVSGMDRDITTDGTAINMLQTDVAINSGNSGGPLFNARGEVVGITSAKYSGTTNSGASIEGISFAIPMDDVIDMLGDLKEYGYIRTAYLGVTCTTAQLSDGSQIGVLIKSVAADGCAEKAGLRAGDIITYVGGYEIKNLSDLTYALRQFKGGDETTITVLRKGHAQYLSIIFDEKNN